MVTTVISSGPDVHHGITGYHTLVYGLFYTLFQGTNEFLGNDTALDIIHELKTSALFHGFYFHKDMAVLASAPGLFDIFTFGIGRFLNSFSIRDLGFTHIGLYFTFPFQSVHNNIQMQLPHTGNKGLPGLFIGLYPESGVFLG